MGTTNKQYAVTDATGSTVMIANYPYREQLWLRNSATGDTVWLAFNETAVVEYGFFLEAGDSLVISGNSAKKDVYMVCAGSESSTVYAELGYGTQERLEQSSSSSSSSSSSIDSSSSSSSSTSSSSSSSEEYSGSSDSSQSSEGYSTSSTSEFQSMSTTSESSPSSSSSEDNSESSSSS